ncbi:MAG: hypothetical protein K2H64_09315 [Desulfovibrio sp.]|nr:hypothetical protein [Desulfovibrio sp.]
MEFANSQTLYANIVIEGGDERARDLVSALLLARAGVNSPAVINANEAASWNKSAPEKLASLIKIETNVLIVRDPEKLSAVAQESLYKFLLKRKLDAAGTDNQLNIITLSGSPLSSLAARGEFSRGLLNILQTEKIALPASSREEHARGDKLDTIDAKDSDPVLNDEESTCFIPGEEERHITEEADEPAGELNLGERIERLQKKCILTALQMANGRKDKAARLLNMNLRTFQRRCAKYGI